MPSKEKQAGSPSDLLEGISRRLFRFNSLLNPRHPVTRLLRPHPLQQLPHTAHLPQRRGINAARPAHLLPLDLDVGRRPLGRDGVFVAEDKHVVVLAEETVHVLEGAVCGLGVEDVDDGQERKIQHDPDDVELPAQGLDADRGDLDDHEVEDPVGGGADGGALCAHAERVDLDRVEPGHALPADAEEDVVEEEEGDRGRGHLLGLPRRVARQLVVPQQHGDDQVAHELASGAEHHQSPPPPPFDVGDRDQGEEKVADAIAGGEKAGELLVQADGAD